MEQFCCQNSKFLQTSLRRTLRTMLQTLLNVAKFYCQKPKPLRKMLQRMLQIMLDLVMFFCQKSQNFRSTFQTRLRTTLNLAKRFFQKPQLQRKQYTNWGQPDILPNETYFPCCGTCTRGYEDILSSKNQTKKIDKINKDMKFLCITFLANCHNI